MFGQPQPPPSQATILNFVWTYVIKLDGTRKARATCDGSKRAGRAVTLAETFAACVDQTSVRIFWATAALQNMLVVGADAGNAFAEAPPPKQEFFMRIDAQYRDWYKHKYSKDIPTGYVVKALKALQGHPELWAKHINQILITMGFTACRHEPCL